MKSFSAGRTVFTGLLRNHVFWLVLDAFAFAFAGVREPICVFSASVHRLHVSFSAPGCKLFCSVL